MDFLSSYSLFLAKTFTVLLGFAGLLILIHLLSKAKKTETEAIDITCLNDKYDDLKKTLEKNILSPKEFKSKQKANKQHLESHPRHSRPRIFVLRFQGDVKASHVEMLRREITSILCVANTSDEIVVLLESPGGIVPYYGLAASQLQRIRDAGLSLTVCVDKMAASGGYLMACVATKITAAPFAYIGSIGVVAQFPNFHRFLKEHHVDFEQVTAGAYKRTLTLFGENTEEDREKMREDLEDIHLFFKTHITRFRPQVDIERVSTGEHWLASRALQLQLVDELITSDDYLLEASKTKSIYLIHSPKKTSALEKITQAFSQLVSSYHSQFLY